MKKTFNSSLLSISLFALTVLIAVAVFGRSASANDQNWQGLYVGGMVSYFAADTDYENSNTPSQDLTGAQFGATIGYNVQFGNWVIGAEADASFGSVDDFVRDGNFLTEDGDIDLTATLRGRLGYSFGRLMPYVTAGYMWTRLEQGLTCPAGASAGVCLLTGAFDTRSTKIYGGWTAGFGAEYALSSNISFKADVLFSDLGTETFKGTVPLGGIPITTRTAVDLDLDYVARAGVNFRF